MKQTTFPSNPGAIHKLMDDIMDALMHNNSLAAIGTKHAYCENVPFRQIIATLKSQIGDNEQIHHDMFGESLLQRIKEFK